MDSWTIYIHSNDGNIHEVEIDKNQTFGEFRKKVSEKIDVNSNDLLLVGESDYNYDYNSKRMCDISGIYDQITLYAVYQVGGGKKI